MDALLAKLKRFGVIALIVAPFAIWGLNGLRYRLPCALNESLEICATPPTGWMTLALWKLAIIPWGLLLAFKYLERRKKKQPISVDAGDVFDRLKR